MLWVLIFCPLYILHIFSTSLLYQLLQSYTTQCRRLLT